MIVERQIVTLHKRGLDRDAVPDSHGPQVLSFAFGGGADPPIAAGDELFRDILLADHRAHQPQLGSVLKIFRCFA